MKRGENKCYKLLVLLQIISFVAGVFVDNKATVDSFTTLLNIIYCVLTLILIIVPWNNFSIRRIHITNMNFFLFFKKWLYFVLKCTILNNILVLILVLIFIPDIASFKNSRAFIDVYERIPYFSILFRYCSVSKFLGLMVFPISAYFFSVNNKKEALKALLLSTSTLIGAIAFYSRAQILTYFLLLICFFFLTSNTFSQDIERKLNKNVKYTTIIITSIFLAISILRFGNMSYYGDRIPQTSLIKEPISYSLFDYTSKGFPNGIDQLEYHQSEDVLYGKQCIYSLCLALSFVHLIDWKSEDALDSFDRSYSKQNLDDNDSGSFHGYTCRMVKNFGYVISLLINICFYFYVKKTSYSSVISMQKLMILTFLLIQPVIAIFYMDYDLYSFPLLFFLFIKILYNVMPR